MTVLKMLMPVAGLIKVRYQGDKADIDSSFFKVYMDYKLLFPQHIILCQKSFNWGHSQITWTR